MANRVHSAGTPVQVLNNANILINQSCVRHSVYLCMWTWWRWAAEVQPEHQKDDFRDFKESPLCLQQAVQSATVLTSLMSEQSSQTDCIHADECRRTSLNNMASHEAAEDRTGSPSCQPRTGNWSFLVWCASHGQCLVWTPWKHVWWCHNDDAKHSIKKD